MLFLFLVAGVLTVLLGLAFLGCLIVGVVLLFSQKLRWLAPFILFIPPLAALGAVGGSWGTAVLVHRAFLPSSSQFYNVLPFWAWVIGFPVGGVLGAALGLGFALLLRRRLSIRSSQPLAADAASGG